MKTPSRHPVEQLLRESADALSPAFNDALHASTLRRIEASRGRTRLVEHTRARRNIGWIAGCAAACALIAITFIAWPTRPTDDAQALTLAVRDLSATVRPWQERASARAMSVQRDITAVGDDTRRLAGFVVDQFPTFIPSAARQQTGDNL